MGTNIDKALHVDKRSYDKDLTQILKYRFGKNMSFGEIAEKTGIPKSTVHSKYQTFVKYANPEAVKDWEDKKPEMLSAGEMVLFNKLMDERTLKKASTNNLAYALDKVNNINRLHRGLSTSNVSVNSLTASLSEIIEEEKKLQKQLESCK